MNLLLDTKLLFMCVKQKSYKYLASAPNLALREPLPHIYRHGNKTNY